MLPDACRWGGCAAGCLLARLTFEQQPPFFVRPIGHVRSPYVEKLQAPRQGTLASGTRSTIVLCDEPRFVHAFEQLERWSHVWVLFWFHLVKNWRPKVLPPRSQQRLGVFATRSPHRPNPIGLTAARLVSVSKGSLELDGLDLLDGTPVLDIKPYVPYADCLPDANSGWLEQLAETSLAAVGSAQSNAELWQVEFAPVAAEQFAWLDAAGELLAERVARALDTGPLPQPYRRIRREGDAGVLALKSWRFRFQVAGQLIRITRIVSGYRAESLLSDERAEHELHRQFERRWPRES